jgi:tetraacyldisaccharide 4'-kinase
MIGTLWSRIRNSLYDRNLLRVHPAPCFAVSLGNLTWGGTGKTALAAHIAGHLLSEGYSVAVVSRGYGRASRGLVVVSDGSRLLVDHRQAGDEAFWLAGSVPAARVLVSEDRIAAFRALAGDPPDVLLMDDAFQHRRAARDLDLVLVDASEDLTAQRVLPFGKLREPPGSLCRADALVLTHASVAHTRTVNWIAAHLRLPVFHADYEPETCPWESRRVAAFCAIGAPRHFFRMLRQTGAEVVLERRFRDHYCYTHQELSELARAAVSAGAEVMVTTAKDAVKLQEHGPWPLPLIVAAVRLTVLENDAFEGFLMEKIRGKGVARTAF